MKKKNPGRPSELHDFWFDDNGSPRLMKMSELAQMTGLSERTVRNRLKAYNRPPADVREFLMFVDKYTTQAEFTEVVKDRVGDAVNMRLDIERKLGNLKK